MATAGISLLSTLESVKVAKYAAKETTSAVKSATITCYGYFAKKLKDITNSIGDDASIEVEYC